MATAQRYLTKSRFKLAVECPRKLFYAGNPEYLDRSLEDSFLAALAEGGYQVGELACLMYPEGVRVDELAHQVALDRTATLLQQENVTIFEAALAVGSLFIRVDILRKLGADVELIEVKAKSYSAREDADLRGAKGQLSSDFLPYLQDVAFQRYVAQQALPGHRIRAFLMLADKEQRASVDGLNQRFRATRLDGRLRVTVAPGTDSATLGQPLLAKVPVDSQVDEILSGNLTVADGVELPFADAVDVFSAAYRDAAPLSPTPSPACSDCQYKAATYPHSGELRSGFHECWTEAFGLEEADFERGTVLDIWNYKGKAKLMSQGVVKLRQVQMEDLGFDGEPPGIDGMTRKHRQWYVCSGQWPEGGEFFFDREGFAHAAQAWRYPLHFIDFETSAVAIPFVRGRRPYETTAFQFSHHVMTEVGRVAHRTDWLNAEPGVDPNFAFVRALQAALMSDEGTVFRWATHENSVLNQIRVQLLECNEPPADRDSLVAFIESITERKGEGRQKVAGPRNMVDLCALAERHFFHPSTKGSNSLKKVLPALMRSSVFLREAYSSAWYGGPGVSRNFDKPVAWWQEKDSQVLDPYELLPPVFDDVGREELDAVEEGLSKELREGGAAMAAYARLQFEDLSDVRRAAMKGALLRYCELDTLAMVMAVQAWMNWTFATGSPSGSSAS